MRSRGGEASHVKIKYLTRHDIIPTAANATAETLSQYKNGYSNLIVEIKMWLINIMCLILYDSEAY